MKQVHLHLVSDKGHVFEVSTNKTFECCIDKIQEMTQRQILKDKEKNFSKKRALFEKSYIKGLSLTLIHRAVAMSY